MLDNPLSAFIRLIGFECARSLRMFVRYPTSSLISILVMTIVFIGLFETATGILGGALSSDINVEHTIQKFILWTTMIMGFSAVSGMIRDETLNGMIETVWMAAVPPAITLTIRGFAATAITFAINIILAFVISLIYQRIGLFSANFFLATLLVSISALGVGLMLGAAVVVFKEIGPAMNLLQFLMLPLFMNDARYVDTVVEAIAPGLFALRFLEDSGNPGLGIVFASGWLGLGIAVMTLAVWHSRRNALVYHY